MPFFKIEYEIYLKSTRGIGCHTHITNTLYMSSYILFIVIPVNVNERDLIENKEKNASFAVHYEINADLRIQREF